MKNEFNHIVREIKLVLKTEVKDFESKKYLIAISGGADSILLFHLFKHLQLSYSVAHINYQLRGQESNADEKFVQKLCKENRVPVYIHKVNTLQKQKKGQSIQMVARDIRYNYFDELLQSHSFDYLVLGHHANDQVETVLLNLFRGSGLNGLTGMKTIDEKKLRPLLNISKNKIVTAIEEKGLIFREDSSNFKNEYKRNYLRNTIIPAIEQRWPGFVSTMMNNIHHFQQEKKALTQFTPSFISLQHGTSIDINQLDLQPNQKNELQKKLVQLGFNSRELTKFLSARTNNESKQLSTGQYLLERKNNQLLFTYHQNTTTPSIEFKKNSLTISGLDKSFYLKTEEKINSAKIKGQISISKWEPGERMIPLGMKGNKKISDVLTELKLTKNQKSSVYVLRDEEKVLWLIGFRLDNRVRLDANQGPDMVLNLKVV